MVFRLTEWVKKEAQSSKKDEEEKIKKLEGKLVQPKHMFSDTKYMEQMRSTSETMDDSLKQGYYKVVYNNYCTCSSVCLPALAELAGPIFKGKKNDYGGFVYF
jgi:hypothetical protein